MYSLPSRYLNALAVNSTRLLVPFAFEEAGYAARPAREELARRFVEVAQKTAGGERRKRR